MGIKPCGPCHRRHWPKGEIVLMMYVVDPFTSLPAKPYVESLDGVSGDAIYQLEPPTTGSQKCSSCGRWIVGPLSYIDNEGMRLCPICWSLCNEIQDVREDT